MHLPIMSFCVTQHVYCKIKQNYKGMLKSLSAFVNPTVSAHCQGMCVLSQRDKEGGGGKGSVVQSN